MADTIVQWAEYVIAKGPWRVIQEHAERQNNSNDCGLYVTNWMATRAYGMNDVCDAPLQRTKVYKELVEFLKKRT